MSDNLEKSNSAVVTDENLIGVTDNQSSNNVSKKKKKASWIKRVLASFFVLLFGGISVCIGFSVRFNLIYEAFTVIGTSMQPTINSGGSEDRDLVFVNTKAINQIKQGDIVVIKEQTREGEYIIKRCIATAGQTVNIKQYTKNGETKYGIFIKANEDAEEGEPLSEDYILNAGDIDANEKTFINFKNYKKNSPALVNDDGSITVGEGEIFVLGDNREVSYDSSTHGPFKVSSIVGRMDFYVKSGTNELKIALLKFKFMFIIK